MSNLTIFEFENQEVRFVGTAETPEWIASDICKILELDTSIAVNGRNRTSTDGTVYRDGGIDDDEKGTVIVSTIRGDVEMLSVKEAGVYRLIFKSGKPVAKRFQKWVLHEVLPSIRKTGKYSVTKDNVQTESEFIKACKDLKLMQEVLGISEDDPKYKKVFDAIVANRFGVAEAIANPQVVVVKSKPTVKRKILKPLATVPSIIHLNGTEPINVICFVNVAETILKKHDITEMITIGFLTRYSRPIKRLIKTNLDELKNAMEILCDAGYLEAIEVNCRGAINYRLLKLPTHDQLRALIPV